MRPALVAGLVAAAVAFAVVWIATPEGEPTAATSAAPPAAGGRAVFVAMGCGSCHRLAAAGSTGEIGPDLDTALRGHTRASLGAFVVDPEGSGLMPDDFGARMDDRQLDELVAFLMASRRGT